MCGIKDLKYHHYKDWFGECSFDGGQRQPSYSTASKMNLFPHSLICPSRSLGFIQKGERKRNAPLRVDSSVLRPHPLSILFNNMENTNSSFEKLIGSVVRFSIANHHLSMVNFIFFNIKQKHN